MNYWLKPNRALNFGWPIHHSIRICRFWNYIPIRAHQFSTQKNLPTKTHFGKKKIYIFKIVAIINKQKKTKLIMPCFNYIRKENNKKNFYKIDINCKENLIHTHKNTHTNNTTHIQQTIILRQTQTHFFLFICLVKI